MRPTVPRGDGNGAQGAARRPKSGRRLTAQVKVPGTEQQPLQSSPWNSEGASSSLAEKNKQLTHSLGVARAEISSLRAEMTQLEEALIKQTEGAMTKASILQCRRTVEKMHLVRELKGTVQSLREQLLVKEKEKLDVVKDIRSSASMEYALEREELYREVARLTDLVSSLQRELKSEALKRELLALESAETYSHFVDSAETEYLKAEVVRLTDGYNAILNSMKNGKGLGSRSTSPGGRKRGLRESRDDYDHLQAARLYSQPQSVSVRPPVSAPGASRSRPQSSGGNTSGGWTRSRNKRPTGGDRGSTEAYLTDDFFTAIPANANDNDYDNDSDRVEGGGDSGYLEQLLPFSTPLLEMVEGGEGGRGVDLDIGIGATSHNVLEDGLFCEGQGQGGARSPLFSDRVASSNRNREDKEEGAAKATKAKGRKKLKKRKSGGKVRKGKAQAQAPSEPSPPSVISADSMEEEEEEEGGHRYRIGVHVERSRSTPRDSPASTPRRGTSPAPEEGEQGQEGRDRDGTERGRSRSRAHGGEGSQKEGAGEEETKGPAASPSPLMPAPVSVPAAAAAAAAAEKADTEEEEREGAGEEKEKEGCGGKDKAKGESRDRDRDREAVPERVWRADPEANRRRKEREDEEEARKTQARREKERAEREQAQAVVVGDKEEEEEDEYADEEYEEEDAEEGMSPHMHTGAQAQGQAQAQAQHEADYISSPISGISEVTPSPSPSQQDLTASQPAIGITVTVSGAGARAGAEGDGEGALSPITPSNPHKAGDVTAPLSTASTVLAGAGAGLIGEADTHALTTDSAAATAAEGEEGGAVAEPVHAHTAVHHQHHPQQQQEEEEVGDSKGRGKGKGQGKELFDLNAFLAGVSDDEEDHRHGHEYGSAAPVPAGTEKADEATEQEDGGVPAAAGDGGGSHYSNDFDEED